MKPIQAIYENGVFRPIEPVDLPEHTRVEVELSANGTEDSERPKISFAKYFGTLKSLPVDPDEFQRKMREEWD